MKTYAVGKRNATVIYRENGPNVVIDIDGVAVNEDHDGAYSGQDEMIEHMEQRDGEYLVFITHPHEDHAAAGEALKGNPDIDVSKVHIAAGPDPGRDVITYDGNSSRLGDRYRVRSENVRDSIAALESGAGGIELMKTDTKQTIGEESDEAVHALWPPTADQCDRLDVSAPAEAEGSADVNNAGLVLRYDVGDQSVLFPGDIEADTEADLLDMYGPEVLDADVLVMPHHGAHSSGSREFLEQVDPEEVVLTAASRPRNDAAAGESQKPDLRTLQRMQDAVPDTRIRWTAAEGRALHGITERGIGGSAEHELVDGRANGGLTVQDVMAIRYAQEAVKEASPAEFRVRKGMAEDTALPDEFTDGKTPPLERITEDDGTVPDEYLELARQNPSLADPPEWVYESTLVEREAPTNAPERYPDAGVAADDESEEDRIDQESTHERTPDTDPESTLDPGDDGTSDPGSDDPSATSDEERTPESEENEQDVTPDV